METQLIKWSRYKVVLQCLTSWLGGGVLLEAKAKAVKRECCVDGQPLGRALHLGIYILNQRSCVCLQVPCSVEHESRPGLLALARSCCICSILLLLSGVLCLRGPGTRPLSEPGKRLMVEEPSLKPASSDELKGCGWQLKGWGTVNTFTFMAFGICPLFRAHVSFLQLSS